MARLTAPNGAVVNVSDSKVDALLGMGFTKVEESKPAPKKASTRKSSK